jgi:hypothetical protein
MKPEDFNNFITKFNFKIINLPEEERFVNYLKLKSDSDLTETEILFHITCLLSGEFNQTIEYINIVEITKN